MTPKISTTFLWLIASLMGALAYADTPPPRKAVQVADRVWFVQGQAALGTPEPSVKQRW